jgi:hypothetical protein
MTSLISFA